MTKDYEVGHGRPPKKNRFQKGAPSPNPYGRGGNPAKKKKQDFGLAAPPVDYLDAFPVSMWEELWRPIPIIGKEGARSEEAIIIANFRKMGIDAMNGSAALRKAYFDQARWLHDRLIEREERFSARLGAHKSNGEADASMIPDGIPRSPHGLPHHDDIVIDTLTGRAWVDGPINEEQHAEELRMLKQRDEAEAKLNEYAHAHNAARSSRQKDKLYALYHEARALFDELNAAIGRGRRKKVNWTSSSKA
jgi:hypothetical protein